MIFFFIFIFFLCLSALIRFRFRGFENVIYTYWPLAFWPTQMTNDSRLCIRRDQTNGRWKYHRHSHAIQERTSAKCRWNRKSVWLFGYPSSVSQRISIISRTNKFGMRIYWLIVSIKCVSTLINMPAEFHVKRIEPKKRYSWKSLSGRARKSTEMYLTRLLAAKMFIGFCASAPCRWFVGVGKMTPVGSNA